MNLEQLKQEEQQLLTALEFNRMSQKKISGEEFTTKLGISIGDIIEFMDGKKTYVGMFDHIEFSGTKASYPVVKLLKKDGSVGSMEKRVWSFNLESIRKVEV